MSNSPSSSRYSLEISATFTAEPLTPALNYWFKRLHLVADINYAPYNQVFQSLLDPNSPFHRNEKGLNLILLRPEDWQRFGDLGSAEWKEELRKNTSEFLDILRTQACRHPSRYLIILTEPSEAIAQDPALSAFVAELSAEIVQRCRGLKLQIVSEEKLTNTYPVADILDPIADHEGHLPYRDGYFHALATLIARRIHCNLLPPAKVLVVDADSTLWPGVAAEIGAEQLEITKPYAALQYFLKSRMEAGMILCLASKNEESDVREVFQKNSGMILREEDIVGWKVNWEPKSENIAALAEQLNLALDSFVFIDDNPMEIAEVSAALPTVTTIRLPQDPEKIPALLAHHWRLDLASSSTKEDSERTAMYQTMLAREEVREQASSYETFLKELKLKVQFEGLTSANRSRLAQLTQRTNQSNTTTIRRQEDDIAALAEQGYEVLAVKVSDRFGDYGLVGLVIFEISNQALHVDSFLLSCRVLGKGVEQKILAQLVKEARDFGANAIHFPFIPSDRNTPAKAFLDGIGSNHSHSTGDGLLYRFPLQVAQAAAQKPAAQASSKPSKIKDSKYATSLISSDDYRTIAMRSAVDQITRDIRAQAAGRPELSELFSSPQGKTEKTIASLWSEVLHLSPIGRQDRFADLGGKSLQVIQLLAKLRRQFQKPISAAELFQNSTIAAQAGLFTEQEQTATEQTTAATDNDQSRDIAIIGMSCRLPESPNVQVFWQNLVDGKECLTQLTDERTPFRQRRPRPSAQRPRLRARERSHGKRRKLRRQVLRSPPQRSQAHGPPTSGLS